MHGHLEAVSRRRQRARHLRSRAADDPWLRLRALVLAARDQEQPEETRSEQERRAEPREQSLAGLLRDLADVARGVSGESGELADNHLRARFDVLGQVGDAVLE